MLNGRARDELAQLARAVAAKRHGRYSAAVRTLLLQRWALIFLLVSRLVVGELGHAMPMAAMSSDADEMALVADDPAACPEHEQTPTNPPGAHHPDSSTEAPDQHDCCNTGECECPCLHVPGAALEADIANPPYVALHRIPDGLQGLMLRQLADLFRPPA
jgi:hypothetical protein